MWNLLSVGCRGVSFIENGVFGKNDIFLVHDLRITGFRIKKYADDLR